MQIALAKGIRVSATIMGGFAAGAGETLPPSDKVRVAREGEYNAESVFAVQWKSLSQSPQNRLLNRCCKQPSSHHEARNVS